MSTRDERQIPCADCREVGRPKAILPCNDPEAWAYYCHDEAKSCFNYVVASQFG